LSAILARKGTTVSASQTFLQMLGILISGMFVVEGYRYNLT